MLGSPESLTDRSVGPKKKLVKQSACDDYDPIIEESSSPQSSDNEYDGDKELDPDAILTGDQGYLFFYI